MDSDRDKFCGTKYVGTKSERERAAFNIILLEAWKEKVGPEKGRKSRRSTKFHKDLDRLVAEGKNADEIERILSETYPDIVSEMVGHTIGDTNRFVLQVNDRIKRFGPKEEREEERENDDER